MGVYAYCVAPAGHAPPAGLTGLNGSKVEVLPVADLSIWIGRMEQPHPALDVLQTHNVVVEAAITTSITPIPLRFGQWLKSEEALTQAIEEQADRYRALLRQFAGCLEFGLRLLDPQEQEADESELPATKSGYEYMQALAARHRSALTRGEEIEQVRTRVHEALGDLVRAEQEEKAATPHSLLTLSHLVARPDFDEYRERARTLRDLLPALRLLLSGPWPPYSFAG